MPGLNYSQHDAFRLDQGIITQIFWRAGIFFEAFNNDFKSSQIMNLQNV